MATNLNAPMRAFTGANIYAHIGHRRVATLQALTVSITREVAGLYAFSDANPKTFVKGKRGIAGSLIFTQFDRHALMMDVFAGHFNSTFKQTGGMVGSRFGGDINSGEFNPINSPLLKTRDFGRNDQGLASNLSNAYGGGGVDSKINAELKSVQEMVANQRLRYSDQIPMFDITIVMMNENGDAAFCEIGGVQLVNEGWGYTIDDLTSEVAYTYVARGVTPLTPLNQDVDLDEFAPNGSGSNGRSFA